MVLYGGLFLISCLKLAVGDVNIILNPINRCVPTTTQSSACLVCVCSTDGVYNCQHLECSGDDRKIAHPTERYCEPHHTYRQDKTICSCDGSGHWRSNKCEELFLQIQPTTSLHKVQIKTNIACIPGHFYITDCNICTCNINGFLSFDSCTNRQCLHKYKDENCIQGDVLRTTKEICACSNINYFIDRLCLKIADQVVQEIETEDLDKIIDIGRNWDDLKISCKPHYTYVLDCNECICDEHGTMHCDDKKCEESPHSSDYPVLRTPLKNQHFQSLPELQNLNTKSNVTLGQQTHVLPEIRLGEPCTPGLMYKLECNTCKCTKEQNLMCTKMACIDWRSYVKLDEGKKSLRESAVKNQNLLLPKLKIGVLCKPGKLYRSNCKRCFCTADNKILCSQKQMAGCQLDKLGNPIPIKTPEDIRPSFGASDMADMETLSKASEKCEPGKSYKVDCNFCSCLETYNLLCQKKMCISYEDMIRLAAQEKSGKPCDTSAPTSEDECHKCDCVNGKTVCRKIPHCNLAGKQLLAHGKEPPPVLDTTYTKCVPNSIYKKHCNKCYCQPDGSLRCTQKTCLNYAQVKLLEKQRLYLKKHGL